MVAKRKVRKDFDPAKEYSVDVTRCTNEEKRGVQQAFFDVGIFWPDMCGVYRAVYAEQYSNACYEEAITRILWYKTSTHGCNMTAKEFLDLVYEPDQQGHIHAELMAQYAEDAKSHAKPWKLWQFHHTGGMWRKLCYNQHGNHLTGTVESLKLILFTV